jgi:hypothetical protein
MTQTRSPLVINDKFMTQQADGSLTSYLEILGVAFQPTRASIDQLLADIKQALASVLSRTGVRLDFLFINQGEQVEPKPWMDGKGDFELAVRTQKLIDSMLLTSAVPVPASSERCLLAITTKIPRHWEEDAESSWHTGQVDYLVHHVFRDHLIRKTPAEDYLVERERNAQPVELNLKDSSVKGTFSALVRELDRRIPWRMSLSILSGHSEAQQQLLRSTRLARWAGALIGRDLLQATDRDLINNEYGDQWLLQARMDFHTSGYSTEQIQSHKKTLEAFLWRCGMTTLGEWRVMGVDDALSLMPITRPGSPWKAGEDSVNFRTPDGKLYPYVPYKRFQRLYNELVVDSFGAAIEAYHRAINRAIVGGSQGKPRLGRITVGSSNPAPELETMLRPADSSVEQRFTLPLHAAINLFDTPLGLQYPTEEQIEDIGCLVQILCKADDYPDSFLYSLTELATQKTYERLSELHRPKAYVPAIDALIDETLGRLNAVNVFSWWEVVSILCEAGENALAQKAQSFAVPQLKDLVETLQADQHVRDSFGYRFDCTRRSLLESVTERLLDVLTHWPALSKPTGLNLEAWRMTTLHIDTGLTVPSLRASQSAAVQYLLARKLLTPGFFTYFDVLYGQAPKAFSAYYTHYYEQEQSIARKICYSDMHTVGDCQPLRKRIISDLHQSRKNGVMVTVDLNTLAYVERDMMHSFTSQVILEPQRMGSTEKEKLRAIDYAFQDHEFDLHPSGEDIALLFKAYLGGELTFAQLLILPGLDQRTG